MDKFCICSQDLVQIQKRNKHKEKHNNNEINKNHVKIKSFTNLHI